MHYVSSQRDFLLRFLANIASRGASSSNVGPGSGIEEDSSIISSEASNRESNKSLGGFTVGTNTRDFSISEKLDWVQTFRIHALTTLSDAPLLSLLQLHLTPLAHPVGVEQQKILS
jgi:hypothetical protein